MKDIDTPIEVSLYFAYHFTKVCTLHKLPQSTCYIWNENLIFLVIHAINER